jgi:hypothetical protein
MKQYFLTSIAGFYDNAYITQPTKVNPDNFPVTEKPAYFNPAAQKLQHTFGPGLYIVFNKNNVITINYGIAVDNQIGTSGLYIGSSLLF